jgi:tetratricopeptide (TPR) repeat protein
MVKSQKKANPKTVKEVSLNPFQNRNETLYFWIFFALAFLVYLPTINFGFVLDDVAVIEQNKFVKQGINGIPDILTTFYWKGYWNLNSGLYRPLSLIMFAVEWAISPENPFIHHFVNILLYAFSIGTLYRLISRLVPNGSHWIPFWISALFMLHPSHTEVVANIKSRDEILAFLFLILLFIQLLKYIQKNEKRFLIWSVLFFSLSLFSKEGAITFLPLIFLFPILINKNNWIQSLKITIPFAVVALIWLVLRYLVINSDSVPPIHYSYLDNSLVACSDFSQLTTGIGLFGGYFLESLLPIHLSYDYSFNQITCKPLLSVEVIFALIVLFGLILLFLKSRKTNPIIAFGSALFLLSIALVTNVFFLIGTTYANRLVYIPSLGILIILVVGSYEFLLKYKPNLIKYFNYMFVPLGIFFLSVTIQRLPAWESNDKLFEIDASHAKNSARVHFNYGTSLMRQSEKFSTSNGKYLEKATLEFAQAISIDSLDFGSHVNLGVCQYRLGNYQESIEATKKAITLNPKDTILYGNLGDAYFSLKQYKNAIEAYAVINASSFQNDTYLNKEGTSFFELKNYKKAISSFEKGYLIAPSNAELKLNLANAYGASGEFEKAANLLSEIYKENPGNENALRLLKITLNELGDYEKLKTL